MKLLAWVVLGCAALGLAVYVMTLPGPPRGPLLFLLFLLFAVPPVGAFWMLYQVIRHEKHPFGLMLLAFLPFTFVWYYFEHARTRSSNDRSPPV